MDLNFAIFQEPRGVMRILQLIFSISMLIAVTGFSGSLVFKCHFEGKEATEYTYDFDYPFHLYWTKALNNDTSNATSCHPVVNVLGDFSSDAKFFVTTGVLSCICCIVLMFIYTKYDNTYKTNNRVPLVDFLLTVFFAVLWLSSSAAWANGLTGLKRATDPSNIWDNIPDACKKSCVTSVSSFSSLNISVVLGFLNFFLWAADLWFVYKETAWFQGTQEPITSGI